MSKNGLLMDDAELVVSFRRAKNQSEQIGVLADLNCTSPMRIAERLDYLGELDGTGLAPRMFSSAYHPVQAANGPAPAPGRIGRPPNFDTEKARRLFAEGKSDAQIAAACCIDARKIRNWRYGAGLIRPKGGNMMKKTMNTETKTADAADAAAVCAEAEEPARDAPAPEGLTLQRLSDLLSLLAKTEGAATRVLISGMAVRGVTVQARYDGSRTDGPAELRVELETW